MAKPHGLILAGGRATRMGGLDKGLQPLAGRPLVAHVIERLAPQVQALSISANRNLADYQALGHPVRADLRPDFAGPLAGIEAALLALPAHASLLVCPCDAPRLPLDLAARLTAPGRPVALPLVGGRPEPAFSLIHAGLAASLTAYLDGGGRQMQAWLFAQDPALVEFDDTPGAFLNLNTLAELHAL